MCFVVVVVVVVVVTPPAAVVTVVANVIYTKHCHTLGHFFRQDCACVFRLLHCFKVEDGNAKLWPNLSLTLATKCLGGLFSFVLIVIQRPARQCACCD